MRKLVAWELVSLDGVMEAPEEWAFSYSNDEMAKVQGAGMAEADAMLLGRVTFQNSHLTGLTRTAPTSHSRTT